MDITLKLEIRNTESRKDLSLVHSFSLSNINDLHNAIKFSTVHHFADNTNLLVSNSCIKEIQDQINPDLKYLCKWLKANKISLNARKN